MSAQLDMFDRASSLRDAGMDLARFAQDDKSPGWSDEAYAAIVSIARRQPTVHVDDVLRAFSARPVHPNAWGAVWMRAIRDRVIERTGTVRPSSDVGKHKHQYPVYRSLVA
jgi:hypothetical protein